MERPNMRGINKGQQKKKKTIGNMFKAMVAGTALATSMGAFANDTERPDDAPYVQEQTELTATTTTDFRRANRIIRLTARVGEENAVEVIDQLHLLSKQDPNAEIELRIHSFGGSVSSGIAIYDAMQSIPNDIRTVCEGPVMSMGAFLLSVGTQGKREANQNCDIMYHQISGGGSGKTSDREIHLAAVKELYSRQREILSKHTGWSTDDLEALMINDLYLTPEEAVEMGFIDNVIQPVKPLPNVKARKKLPKGFCDKEERRFISLCNK
jgi:ATP-dependent Clp protease protease subunit